jgi:DNA-binding protein HU-beta
MSDEHDHDAGAEEGGRKKGKLGKKGERDKENQYNRGKLVGVVSEKIGLPRGKTIAAVDAIFESIEQALKEGHEVRLMGFGTFIVGARKAAKGRNPRTGEEIDVPPTKSVRFRPGKTLKEAVGGGAK